MVGMNDEKKVALEMAKFWAEILEINQPIKITLESEYPFSLPSVNKEKRDIVEISLFATGEPSDWIKYIVLHQTILHELLNWKYPGYDENAITDMELPYLNDFMEKIREEYRERAR